MSTIATKSAEPNKKKQIGRKIFLIILVLTPLVSFVSLSMTLYLQTPTAQTAWVSWYDDPQHQVYIGWETETETRGTVIYGINSENLNESIIDPQLVSIHIVNLTNLNPNTVYYYKVILNNQVYAQGQFRTAPDTWDPCVFALTSDTQPKYGPGWHSRAANILSQKNYSFIAMVGDISEDGVKAEWNDFLTRASVYLDTTPLVPVQGNHDRPKDKDGDGTNEYYFAQYFPQTKDTIRNTNKYDQEPQFYYSFNWSSVHIQVLHFPQMDIDDEGEPGLVSKSDYYEAFTTDQLAWIKEDLQRAQSMPFRITLFHCPITGAGFYGINHILIDELLPILQTYNVTATVHGHSHHYERGHLGNLTYFVVGCGGGLVDVGSRPIPETDSLIVSPCYTEVHTTANTLTFRTYGFDGTLYDEYIINSRGVI